MGLDALGEEHVDLAGGLGLRFPRRVDAPRGFLVREVDEEYPAPEVDRLLRVAAREGLVALLEELRDPRVALAARPGHGARRGGRLRFGRRGRVHRPGSRGRRRHRRRRAGREGGGGFQRRADQRMPAAAKAQVIEAGERVAAPNLGDHGRHWHRRRRRRRCRGRRTCGIVAEDEVVHAGLRGGRGRARERVAEGRRGRALRDGRQLGRARQLLDRAFESEELREAVDVHGGARCRGAERFQERPGRREAAVHLEDEVAAEKSLISLAGLGERQGVPEGLEDLVPRLRR